MTLPTVFLVAVTVAFVLLAVMLWWLARRRDDVMSQAWLERHRPDDVGEVERVHE